MTHIKYQHYFLTNDCVLTVASALDKEASKISVGYTICNTKIDKYIKKIGNAIATERLHSNPLLLTIPIISNVNVYFANMFINHEFLSWLIVSSIIKENTSILPNRYGVVFSEETYQDLFTLEFYLKQFKLKPKFNSFFSNMLDQSIFNWN